MRKLSRILLLPILSLIVVFLSMFLFTGKAHAACGGDDTLTFNTAGELDCGDEIYKYDPYWSQTTGYPSFVESTGHYISIRLGSNGEIEARLILTFNQRDPFNAANGQFDEISLTNYRSADNQFRGGENGSTPGTNFCSMIKLTDCLPWDGGDYDDYQGTGDPPDRFNGSEPRHIGDTVNVNGRPIDLIQAIRLRAEAEEALDDCEDTLNSPLTFIVCPVQNFLVEAIGATINAMVRLLENPVLINGSSSSATATAGKVQLRDGVGAMVTLANSFYILIFLFIIIANFVAIPGLDNYTIKKTLPKLIAAIILTQFSLLICQVVLDLGNILGNTLPQFLLQSFNVPGGTGGAPPTPAEAFSCLFIPTCGQSVSVGGIFQTIGQFVMLQISEIVGLIVAIIAFFYLMLRYLALIALVLFAPIAFAAWVLPNTEKFFKQWWKYMIKLSIMFLLVNLLFAVGAIFVNLLQSGVFNSGGTVGFLDQFLLSLISIFVPIIILALVPKTLKLSGDIMGAAGKAIANTGVGKAAIGAGKGAVKKSGQEGKLAELKAKGFGAASDVVGGSNTKFGRSLKQNKLRTEDRVTEAKKKDIGLMDVKDQIALSKQKRNGEFTPDAKVAQKVLQKAYRDKLVEGKQGFDAGLPPLNSKQRAEFDEIAKETGGRTYQESIVAWDTEKQIRNGSTLSPALQEQKAYNTLYESTVRQVANDTSTPPPPAGVPLDVHHKRIAFDQMHAGEVAKQERLNPHLPAGHPAHQAAATASLNSKIGPRP